MGLNPNEAPKGYRAVASKGGCGNCPFVDDDDCAKYHCMAHQRADKTSVTFKLLPTVNPDEAPKGHIAVLGTGRVGEDCSKCACRKADGECREKVPCADARRQDGCHVYFIKKGPLMKPQIYGTLQNKYKELSDAHVAAEKRAVAAEARVKELEAKLAAVAKAAQ